MEIERRALYNLMRLNWLRNPTMSVEPWQVDDYREMSLETLFERLRLHDLTLDRKTFIALSDSIDSPENFTDALLADVDTDMTTQDQVYLLVFELWRRLLPEKPCLSVFCDELDHQIHYYDTEDLTNSEGIQDAIASLQSVLDENTDEGADSLEVFQSISSGCANDVESFLYDYISDQIDADNLSYASDLLDGFNEYVSDIKWFEFLRARYISQANRGAINEYIPQLIHDADESPDIEYNLELLSFLVQGGGKPDFIRLVKKTIPLLQIEEDFQDLLTTCTEFFHRLDEEKEEKALAAILRKRMHLHLEGMVTPNDPHVKELLLVLK